MTLGLVGKTAIVTGAARGIGAAIAKTLARQGADIALVDLKAEDCETVSAEIKSLGRKTRCFGVNVADYAKSQAMVAEAIQAFGKIDILVNNAGIIRDAFLSKLTEEQWDSVIDVNLKGVFNLGQACAKEMAVQKSGCIVNISSVAWKGNIGQSNYSASKAGVIGLTTTWAIELARWNIRVNAVAPGFIDSVMTQQVPTDVKERFVQKIPLRRMGQPEEIAEVVCFLCEERARYLTGQVIHVDGGLTAGINAL